MAAVVITGCAAPHRDGGTVASATSAASRDVQAVATSLLAEVDALLGTSGAPPSIEISSSDPAIAGSGLAAVTVTSSGTTTRLIIDPHAIAAAPDGAVDALIAHEMVHVRLQQVTSPHTPLWAVEGFADYIGFTVAPVDEHTLRVTAAAEGIPGEPPGDAAFHGPRAGRDAAYAQAFLLWQAIGEAAGLGGARTAYDAIALDGDQAAFDAAVAQATGLGRAELLAAWRATMEPATS